MSEKDQPNLARHALAGATDPSRQVHWTEEIIQSAQRRGDFDNLPGKGKPSQVPEYDPYAGPEAESYRILKNAGFVPEWIDLRTKIIKEIEALRTCGPVPERPSRIVEVNILVQQHNRLVPGGSLTIPKLPSDLGL